MQSARIGEPSSLYWKSPKWQNTSMEVLRKAHSRSPPHSGKRGKLAPSKSNSSSALDKQSQKS